MPRLPRPVMCVVLVAATLLAPALPATGQAGQADPADLWADFGHYIRIGSPQRAADAATVLVNDTDPGSLLDAVEASRFTDTASLFRRAQGMEGVADLAGQLESKIQEARLGRSREESRIADDIESLVKGQRAYLNATQRLTAAGQFAAPQMLSVLTTEDRDGLHAAVRRAMIDIGRPVVAPLAIALPKLGAVAQGQVAEVLGSIGYPQAAPALAAVVENPDTDPTARDRAREALDRIVRNSRLDGGLSAAQRYLRLGESQYATATTDPTALDGYDSANDTGIVWVYDPQLTVTGEPGLTPLPVPGVVLGDVLAMKSAETALGLNRNLDPALSLFIAANLRRENRLPDGETDPSYAADRQEPSYYAMVAGPQRLNDVLQRALDANDAALALDAIDAISRTAGTDAVQPLTRGLTYSDRLVRYRAAQALAFAEPTRTFDAAYRVVPVLANSIRQAGSSYATVLSPDQDTRNTLNDAASSLGYQPLAAGSVAEAANLLRNAPGVDLVIVGGEPRDLRDAISAATANPQLANAPIIALTRAENRATLADEFSGNPRITVVAADPAAPGDALNTAVEEARQRYSGATLTDEEATALALRSLELLEQIAMNDNSVFNAADALPALVEATGDERPEVAMAAGDVLARLDNPDAQSQLADAALDAVGDVQIALLVDLAESANTFGNRISPDQGNRLTELVKTSRGDLAVAAAQAHGALTLPTSNAVDLILSTAQ